MNAFKKALIGSAGVVVLSVSGVVTVLVLVAGLSGTAIAAAQPNSTESRRNNIEGRWIVTVTRVNPPPTVAPTFRSLMTFDSGGGMIETSNTGTTARGPAHGVWERINGRLYATTMLFFRFNSETGAFTSTGKINRTMRLSQDGQTFEAVAQLDIYDPNGVLTQSSRSTETGERIDVQRIAAQP